VSDLRLDLKERVAGLEGSEERGPRLAADGGVGRAGARDQLGETRGAAESFWGTRGTLSW
jgi:hypothetical protein